MILETFVGRLIGDLQVARRGHKVRTAEDADYNIFMHICQTGAQMVCSCNSGLSAMVKIGPNLD